MPAISMFYGIVIYMRYEASAPHHLPHIHVSYGEQKSVFDLDGNLLAGNLANRQKKLVIAWIAIHHEELAANWELASQGCELFPILPLR